MEIKRVDDVCLSNPRRKEGKKERRCCVFQMDDFPHRKENETSLAGLNNERRDFSFK